MYHPDGLVLIVLDPSRQTPASYLRIGHDNYIPHRFHFIIGYQLIIQRHTWFAANVVE
jgi:hypothetical protein